MLRLRFVLLTLACLAGAALLRAAPAAHTLYLVRHGYYDPVAGGDPKVTMGLNATGRAQAELVAARLAALPVKFAAVHSSEYARARETGDIIAAKLGQSCGRDPALNETTPPGLGLDAKHIDADAVTQLERAWARYAQPADGAPVSEILACHGNVIRWFVCRALGVDTTHWTRLEIANCSLTIIQFKADGTTKVQVFSDAAHLPLELQTWSGQGPGWPLPAQAKK